MALGGEGKLIYIVGFNLIMRYSNSDCQVNRNTVLMEPNGRYLVIFREYFLIK